MSSNSDLDPYLERYGGEHRRRRHVGRAIYDFIGKKVVGFYYSPRYMRARGPGGAFSIALCVLAAYGGIALLGTFLWFSQMWIESTELSMFAVAPYGPAAPEMRSYALTGPGTGRDDAVSLEQSRAYLALQQWLRSTLHAQFSVPVIAARCPAGTAYQSSFLPQFKRVLICTDYLDRLGSDMRRRGLPKTAIFDTTSRAFAFVTMHELGHELIHDRRLPITGREEDAVDDLATIVAVQMKRPDIALAGAALFAAHAGDAPAPPYDGHSPHAQRVGRIRCLVYGSDPAHGGAIAQADHYTPQTSDACIYYWAEASHGWSVALHAPALAASLFSDSLPQAQGAEGASTHG